MSLSQDREIRKKKMTDLQQKIIDEIKKNGDVTQTEIAEKAAVTPSSISRNIEALMERGIIKKISFDGYKILPESEWKFFFVLCDETTQQSVKKKIMNELRDMGYKNLNDFAVDAINKMKINK